MLEFQAMIVLCLFLALIFVIAVVFYRQRRPELEILQIEETQVSQRLPELLEERQPIVIRGTALPYSFTPGGLHQIPRLHPFPVGATSLGAVLKAGSLPFGPPMDAASRELLAKELAIPIWANRTWLPRLTETSLVGQAVGTMQAEAFLGGLGLRRTTAVWTCILPTHESFVASLVSQDSEEFLPVPWEGRAVASLTANDTPLVGELRCMDVVLRPGTMLCLPAHVVVSLDPRDAGQGIPMGVWLEYHEPMSLLAKTLAAP